jgi:hypothetical protein
MSLPLLYPKDLWNKCAQFKISLLVVTYPSHISCVLTLKISAKEYKPHVGKHHDIIIVIIIIIVILTLCYSIMSHATLNSLVSFIHVNTTNFLDFTCTLVATCIIWERLEFSLLVVCLCSKKSSSYLLRAHKVTELCLVIQSSCGKRYR